MGKSLLRAAVLFEASFFWYEHIFSPVGAFQHVTGMFRAFAPLISRLVLRSVGGACVRARSRRPSRRRSWSFSSGASQYRASLWASTPRSGSRRSLRSAAFSWSLRRSLAAAGVRTRKAPPCLGKPPRTFPQIKEHFGATRPNSLMMWRFIRAGLRLAYTTTRQIIRGRGASCQSA